MKIDFIIQGEHGTRKVYPSKSLPSECVLRGAETAKNRNWFTLMPGMPDVSDIKGEIVQLAGLKYSINYRKYDLATGYAVEAKLTPNNQVIPVLRKALGKEVTLSKDKNGVANNAYWPVIVKLNRVETAIEPEQEKFSKEALSHDYSQITESFNGNMDDDEEFFNPETLDSDMD